jgi:hypothetical protein
MIKFRVYVLVLGLILGSQCGHTDGSCLVFKDIIIDCWVAKSLGGIFDDLSLELGAPHDCALDVHNEVACS